MEAKNIRYFQDNVRKISVNTTSSLVEI